MFRAQARNCPCILSGDSSRNFRVFASIPALAAAGLLALGASAPAAAAQIADDPYVAARIRAAEAWFDYQMTYELVPGAVIGIVHDQELVWASGYGFADEARTVPVDTHTRFSICSVTKLFTSTAVMQLRDAGAIELDAPISEYLPWAELQANETSGKDPVTLRGILSHVAGLPREAATPYWTESVFPAPETIRERAHEQDMFYRPFTQFQYSNLGLTMAGEAVAAASGEDFHSYIREHILEPLGLSDTVTDLPMAERGKTFATGYWNRDAHGKRRPFDNYKIDGIAPAAGIASSITDLGKFASWQFRNREGDHNEVLASATLREMQRVHWIAPDWDGAAWGLGYSMSRRNGKTFVGHGGYCPGYRTSFITRPEDKIAAIAMVAVNDISPSDYTGSLYDFLAPAIKKAAKASENENPEAAEDGPDFSIYEGRYESPVGGYNSSYLAVTPDGLISVGLGGSRLRAVELNHVEGHTFRQKTDDGTVGFEVTFELDADGRVTRSWRFNQYSVKVD